MASSESAPVQTPITKITRRGSLHARGRRGKSTAVTEQIFPFRFDMRYRVLAFATGVAPTTARVRLDESQLEVRFGPWTLRTAVPNIADVSITGPYSFVKTAGPAHLSFSDRGVTFATNGGAACASDSTSRCRRSNPPAGCDTPARH